MKRIYETSLGYLELEAFDTFDSHEVWLTFFDEEGRPRLRKSWGSDAFEQPDFKLDRQIRSSLRYEGFPVVESERLATQIDADFMSESGPA